MRSRCSAFPGVSARGGNGSASPVAASFSRLVDLLLGRTATTSRVHLDALTRVVQRVRSERKC